MPHLKCPVEECHYDSLVQKFCVYHGDALVANKYPICSCGDEVWRFQKFCGKCGRPASEAKMPVKQEDAVQNLCKTP